MKLNYKFSILLAFETDCAPSAQWASTGGQVAYFKKIYFFFLISLVLSFSLMFNYEPNLLRHPDIAPLL